MHEFNRENKNKRRRQKFYLIAFAFAASIHLFMNFFGLGAEKFSGFRMICSVLFFTVVFYFGVRRKFWAEIIIKPFVWLNIFLLLLIIIITSLGLK